MLAVFLMLLVLLGCSGSGEHGCTLGVPVGELRAGEKVTECEHGCVTLNEEEKAIHADAIIQSCGGINGACIGENCVTGNNSPGGGNTSTSNSNNPNQPNNSNQGNNSHNTTINPTPTPNVEPR